MARIKLATLQETEAVGKLLAALCMQVKLPALLLDGPLGCGKTALTASLCAALRGSHAAEIGSPSFNICNFYPCTPPVLHCDFYRCGYEIPDEVWDFLEQKNGLLIVEWPEIIRPQLKEFLDISFDVFNDSRWLEIRASGEKGKTALAALSAALHLI